MVDLNIFLEVLPHGKNMVEDSAVLVCGRHKSPGKVWSAGSLRVLHKGTAIPKGLLDSLPLLCYLLL